MRPLYYCPPGIERPAHIRDTAPVNTSVSGSPDGAPGLCYGGSYEPGEWVQAAPGWWYCLRCQAEQLGKYTLRADAIPGFPVRGWVVPRILDRHGCAAVGYFGATGWQVPAHLSGIVERMRAILDDKGAVTEQHAALAFDLLAINHHISLIELERIQLLDRATIIAVLLNAADFDPETASALVEHG